MSDLDYQRNRLEKEALAYARMKAFGSYIDSNGHECLVCGDDRKSYMDSFTQAMRYEADMLLLLLVPKELPPRKTS
mgnify:CR=1 FL=1